ncbi:hypothetical protein A6V39_00735 [Candidatus Mycoplasma haematobovis]|uniref:Uncharacterized protein n=1 Tax=Candidatus Mycoplasma haematobovis TaxID=432608 RepID=A0A1A9QDM6_9MOLU|nr:hypothetical protein [Candidatus Mycoplasma haematobovis]OAL10577.1 hypothetical protein A6V39_00735 [Candidatus Mycoplasma haematobovis]
MKSIATKALIGVLGAGTVATGVVFAALPESYESYLNKQGRPLLTGDSGEWEKVKTKYSQEGDDLLIKIDGKEIKKTELQIDQLKTWCSQNSKKSFSNTKDSIYQRISAWCTKPKTISEQVEKGMLNDEESPTAESTTTENIDETTWKIKAKDYKTTTESYLIKIINDRGEEGEVIVANSTTAIETKKLRAWCKYSKAKHFKHEEDQRYLTYKKWCVN